MSATVSVVLVVESTAPSAGQDDAFLLTFAQELNLCEIEATLLFNGARAAELLGPRQQDLATTLKRHNLGLIAGKESTPPLSYLANLDWETGAREFRKAEHRHFLDVSRLAGHLPTAVSLGEWAPQAFSVIADWGPRVYLGPDSFIDHDTKPFFICGRLHLASLGTYWIDVSLHSLLDPTSIQGVVGQVHRRAEQYGSTNGVIVLRLEHQQTAASSAENAAAAAKGFVSLVQQLKTNKNVAIQSARQFADQYADVSYDQAITLDFFKSMVNESREPELHAVAHEQGYLSPAEQLFGIAKIWLDSIVKGKALRSTTVKTPLGPTHKETTDSSVKGIAAAELHDLLAHLCQNVENKGLLPSSVKTKEGKIAVEDLLPTLAGGFPADLKPVDLPLRHGTIDSSPIQQSRIKDALAAVHSSEVALANLVGLTERQLWTFKPVLGL
jgi:hypothetical protein